VGTALLCRARPPSRRYEQTRAQRPPGNSPGSLHSSSWTCDHDRILPDGFCAERGRGHRGVYVRAISIAPTSAGCQRRHSPVNRRVKFRHPPQGTCGTAGRVPPPAAQMSATETTRCGSSTDRDHGQPQRAGRLVPSRNTSAVDARWLHRLCDPASTAVGAMTPCSLASARTAGPPPVFWKSLPPVSGAARHRHVPDLPPAPPVGRDASGAEVDSMPRRRTPRTGETATVPAHPVARSHSPPFTSVLRSSTSAGASASLTVSAPTRLRPSGFRTVVTRSLSS